MNEYLSKDFFDDWLKIEAKYDSYLDVIKTFAEKTLQRVDKEIYKIYPAEKFEFEEIVSDKLYFSAYFCQEFETTSIPLYTLFDGGIERYQKELKEKEKIKKQQQKQDNLDKTLKREESDKKLYLSLKERFEKK